MSVDKKREEVLESLYEEMAHKSNYTYDKTLAETIKALESARAAEKESKLKENESQIKAKEMQLKEQELQLREKEFNLKDAVALTDNANAEIDRKQEDRIRLRELVVNSVVALLPALVWGTIFVVELTATRKFEETGTETSAASRWLKNSFPKVKGF